MGIFNEHSYNNPFARGIQGAQGVGFNLTSDGNYDMVGKKLTNVGDGVNPSDAATKKYVDDNTTAPDLSPYLKKDGSVPMTGDFNVGGH
ncbi:unnamed protein product, partial [Porites evermanni]